MSRSIVSVEPIPGMSARQCCICGKHINHDRVSSIDRALAGHLKMHVRYGQAKRETIWRNSRGANHSGRAIVVYRKVEQEAK